MTVRLRRVGPTRPSARLLDFLPAADACWLHTDGRQVWREVARCAPAQVVVERWSEGAGARMLDRTTFEVYRDGFAEVAHQRAADGSNLLPRPIRLPAELAVGDWRDPVPGVRITLLHAGPIALTTEHGVAHLDAIGLCADTGAERRLQWLARGEGVVALGPLRGPPTRWRLSPCTMSTPPGEPTR